MKKVRGELDTANDEPSKNITLVEPCIKDKTISPA